MAAYLSCISSKVSFALPGDLIHHFSSPTPEGPQNFDRYGASIAAMGNNIIIGAYGSRTGGQVFIYDGTTNSFLKTIDNAGSGNDQFGWSTATSNSDFLVGARLDGINDIGAAYRFNQVGTLLNTYENPNPLDNSYFGQSLAYSGNNVVIGSRGQVSIFDTESGSLLQQIFSPTPSLSDSFGIKVSTSNNSIIVSAISDDTGGVNSGAVHIFDSNTGLLTQTLYNPDPGIQYFGSSIASNGNKILVGAPDGGLGGPDTFGKAYVFDETTGLLLLTINDPDGSISNLFGGSVEWLGDDILIGAKHTNSGGDISSGAAYLFSGDTGGLINTFLGTGDVPILDEFGHSILGFNGDVLVGSVNEDYFFGCTTFIDEFGNENEQCEYINSGGVSRFEAATTVVPLPASLWLFGTGLLSLIGFSKRKARV